MCLIQWLRSSRCQLQTSHRGIRPSIFTRSSVHHFRVSNDATVAYPLNKDVSATGTGSDEEETDKVEASGMHEEGTDEAFDITVKDWSVVIYIMANCTSVKFSHSNETVGCLASFDNIVKTG